MKQYKLLSQGMLLLITLIVVGTGILIPSLLLEWQENKILQQKRAFPIQTEELKSSEQSVSPDAEYQQLNYRLIAWRVLKTNVLLNEPEEYELSKETALNKAQQELSRLIELGALPEIDLDEFELDTIELYGGKMSPNTVQELLYRGMEHYQFNIDRRISRWMITWNNSNAKNEILSIEMDAQTGKIYSCTAGLGPSVIDKLIGNEENAAMMFGKYHDLLQYRAGGDSFSDGYREGYSVQNFKDIFITCAFYLSFNDGGNQPFLSYTLNTNTLYY